ncbi:MAG: transcription elongation factor GreA [Candidatus Paceibacterota bacterium]|jgi:transcription elongation factor GreA|nr:transcription elongation factor GreA [Candidatus Paceibacterota bacterium]MDD4831050.1 transcription elongation factor GreA [Candidatus Paceibacterota bacterium]MDD4875438.1 transcription elongation factor GreA [Candidatus Paceibacterota bacterium]
MTEYLTPEGLEKLRKELDHLINVERKEVAKDLEEAISYGDLSENAAYTEAKEHQASLEQRILELEAMIKNAKVVEMDKDCSKVQVGSTVFLSSGKMDNKYMIVGANEANPFENKISYASPLGKALMDQIKGATVEVPTPEGVAKYKITRIEC